jgi:hypothetical protein
VTCCELIHLSYSTQRATIPELFKFEYTTELYHDSESLVPKSEQQATKQGLHDALEAEMAEMGGMSESEFFNQNPDVKMPQEIADWSREYECAAKTRSRTASVLQD